VPIPPATRDASARALVADRDHVGRRLEKVRKDAKWGSRDEAEPALLEELADHLDEGKSLAEWARDLPPALEPLTTKPLIPVENGPNGVDCALEMELAELPPAEAAEFRSGPSALDEVVHRLKDALGLVTFFTLGDTEARSWTLRHGESALDAAESIHKDIARGFIRCEVIRWDDLGSSGLHASGPARPPAPEGRRTSSRMATSSTSASTSEASAGRDERGPATATTLRRAVPRSAARRAMTREHHGHDRVEGAR
jgi:hypothetical protein